MEIALRIGTNPDHRRALRRKILENNSVPYENRRIVSEFERFFEAAWMPDRAQKPATDVSPCDMLSARIVVTTRRIALPAL